MKKIFILSLFLVILTGCVTNDYNTYQAPTPTQKSVIETRIVESVNIPTPIVEKQVPAVEEQVGADSELSNDNYYINSEGNKVHSPAYSDTVPAGATAICGDGTYSFSQNRRGTCSHHGGVVRWLY